MHIFGVAADDTHSLTYRSPQFANPGTGWVVVRAKSLDADEIVRNLDTGLFYSSTGVELEDVRITPLRLEIQIKARGNVGYTTDFIGAGGRVLHSTKENLAAYNLSAEDADGATYVRARVTDPSGHHAWVQPVFIRKEVGRAGSASTRVKLASRTG